MGTLWVPDGCRRSGAGGLRQLPRVCTRVHTHTYAPRCAHACAHTEAEQSLPPVCRQNVAPPHPPQTIPVPWGTAAVAGKGVVVGGREPIDMASGLLAPAPPHSLAMQGEGS